MEENKPRRK